MIFTKAFTTFLLSTASSASLKGVIATANGLRLSEDSKPTADASSFTALMNGLQLHQDESEATKTSDKLLTILSNCLGETLELEKCYGEHEAVLTECVDCAWIDVLSGSSGIHCDNGIKDVCEENAATCASCLNNECGEKQASLLSCAVDLYCPVEEEEEEEEEDIEYSEFNLPLVAESDGCSYDGRTCNSDNDCCKDSRPMTCQSKVCTHCFSLESKVFVKDKGSTFIKDLAIGDMVLSDEKGTYTKYYSKGHLDDKKHTNFLRIYTELNVKPLELTPGHMVYTSLQKLPVPANSIKVGDILKTIDGPSKVTSVRKISRKGLANPLTLSGSIVVDGIVSSIHNEESGFEGNDAGWIYLAGLRIAHWHTLMHFIHAPHRIICGIFMMCTETLTEDGLVLFHQYLVSIHAAAEETQSVVFSVLVLLLLVAQTIVFSVLELLLQHAAEITLAAMCFVIGKWFVSKTNLNKKVKEE